MTYRTVVHPCFVDYDIVPTIWIIPDKEYANTANIFNHSEDSCGPVDVRRTMVAEFILSQQQQLLGGPGMGPAPAPPRGQPIPPRGRLSVSPHFGMDEGPPPQGSHDDDYNSFDYNKRKEFFGQRKQREFIPDSKKDDGYWDRRRRNNEAAKRSREKRRFNDMVLEQRVVELSKENHVLKAQLDAIKEKYGICGETLISIDQVLATLPTCDQVLCVTKRSKMSPSGLFPPAPPPPPAPPASPPSPPPQRAPEPYQERLPAPEAYYPHPAHYEPPGSVLNLSRSRRVPSPYELSSLSGSGDENTEQYAPENNGLPLKLRHKSHLGDKDVASALLSLQHIKQEPGPRSSPSWDGEGSSDERDSGISIGAEFRPARPEDRLAEEEDAHLKAELARLATEVATLKNMMHQNKARAHEH